MLRINDLSETTTPVGNFPIDTPTGTKRITAENFFNGIATTDKTNATLQDESFDDGLHTQQEINIQNASAIHSLYDIVNGSQADYAVIATDYAQPLAIPTTYTVLDWEVVEAPSSSDIVCDATTNRITINKNGTYFWNSLFDVTNESKQLRQLSVTSYDVTNDVVLYEREIDIARWGYQDVTTKFFSVTNAPIDIEVRVSASHNDLVLNKWTGDFVKIAIVGDKNTYEVKVDETDSQGYLGDKLLAGDGIQLEQVVEPSGMKLRIKSTQTQNSGFVSKNIIVSDMITGSNYKMFYTNATNFTVKQILINTTNEDSFNLYMYVDGALVNTTAVSGGTGVCDVEFDFEPISTGSLVELKFGDTTEETTDTVWLTFVVRETFGE